MEKPTKTNLEPKLTIDDLEQYWKQRPEASILYQVGEQFFFELHYAENYAKITEPEIITHQKDGKDTK